jgi:hypothetical protein
MSTQLSDIKNKITYWVDDLNKGYFTDIQLNRFVNDAQFECQKYLCQAGSNYFLTVAETPLVVNQREYVLPVDFLHLHRLEIVTANDGLPTETTDIIEGITLNQQDTYPLSPGNPRCYYFKANRLILTPAPQQAYPLRLTYAYRVPVLILDTDLLSIPDEYAEYVAILAAIDCYLKDGRDCSILLTKKTFYEDMMKKEAQDRRNDKPRHVVLSDGGMGILF